MLKTDPAKPDVRSAQCTVPRIEKTHSLALWQRDPT